MTLDTYWFFIKIEAKNHAFSTVLNTVKKHHLCRTFKPIALNFSSNFNDFRYILISIEIQAKNRAFFNNIEYSFNALIFINVSSL